MKKRHRNRKNVNPAPRNQGDRYGRLSVISYSYLDVRRGAIWNCKCDCGAECLVAERCLRVGDTKSCGCLRREQRITHGLSESPEYRAWGAMRERCRDPRCKSYYRYGGRGINVCDRWYDSFEAFYEDMGPRPSTAHSVDRIDTFGDYEPSNCRWATIQEQQNNTRANVVVEFQGKRQTLTQWARVLGIKSTTLATRLDRGWTIERALRQSVGNYRWKLWPLGRPSTPAKPRKPKS